jgi:glycerol-3-phosphate acyltransferase PlsY
MIFLKEFAFLLLTYAVAAIPFGLVLAKIFGKIDIREKGSKNIGATNVARVLGKKLGFLTLILDGLKGAIMVIIARFSFSEIEGLHIFLVLVSAVAVIGHVYPIYLQFKGGKGVATALAVLFALDFGVGILATSFWIMTFCLFRISSISSLVAIFSSIIISSHFDAPASQILLCGFLSVLILVKHKENIIRILTGKEKSFSTDKKS